MTAIFGLLPIESGTSHCTPLPSNTLQVFHCKVRVDWPVLIAPNKSVQMDFKLLHYDWLTTVPTILS